MTLLLAATMMFLLPLGFLALVAAAAGFFCARLQPIILAAMAWGVGRFCAGLAAASPAPAHPTGAGFEQAERAGGRDAKGPKAPRSGRSEAEP